MKSSNFTVKRVGDVIEIEVPFERNGSWKQDFLLRADAHHDSPHCDRNLEKRHLDDALEDGAIIIDGGDLFDAMQSAGDKRGGYSELRDEYKHGNYIDKLVEVAAKRYGPYAKNIAVLAQGNHETAMIKHHNTDLTERLVYALNKEHGGNIVKGGYLNIIRIIFRDKTSSRSKIIYHHHGSGGGAKVTKGVIDMFRMSVEIPYADFWFMGHIHNENIFQVPCEEITDGGNRSIRKRYGIRVAGYKNEHGKGGWHDERGHGVRPLGSARIRFFWDRVTQKITEEVFSTAG